MPFSFPLLVDCNSFQLHVFFKNCAQVCLVDIIIPMPGLWMARCFLGEVDIVECWVMGLTKTFYNLQK